MADGTQEIIEPLDNHPCKSPRGMLYYNVEVLTKDQQTQLNKLKINTIRENEKYLAAHPEVRAIVALITRIIFKNRPRSNIHSVIIEYFKQPRAIIQNDIDNYIKAREPHVYEGDSAVVSVGSEEERLEEEYYEEELPSVLSEIQEEELENVPLEVLNEIIEKALKQLDIEVDDDETAIRKMIEKEIISRVGLTLSEDLRLLLEREMWERIGGLSPGPSFAMTSYDYDTKEPSLSDDIAEPIEEEKLEKEEKQPEVAQAEETTDNAKPEEKQEESEDKVENPTEVIPPETTPQEESPAEEKQE